VPEEFIALLSQVVQDRGRALSFRACDWASLMWGLASLGAPIEAETMAAINANALEHLPDMTPVELCNLLWWVSRHGSSHLSLPFRVLECHKLIIRAVLLKCSWGRLMLCC
jgi:hypothetical protein